MDATPAGTARTVLVIGGGPAGLECAIRAAGRGHRVTLAEQGDELGGALITLARTSRQSRFGDYLDHVRREVAAAAIDVRLGTRIDVDAARSLAPDVIVVASGARWREGIGVPVLAALGDPDRLGPAVTVVGGRDDHLPPLVAADYLAGTGRRVTLLVEAATPGSSVEPASLYALMRRLHEAGVTILPFTAATGFGGGVLRTRNTLTNGVGEIADPGDIIDVDGRVADGDAASSLAAIASKLHLIGDALAPRRMLHATLDGSRLALQIA